MNGDDDDYDDDGDDEAAKRDKCCPIVGGNLPTEGGQRHFVVCRLLLARRFSRQTIKQRR